MSVTVTAVVGSAVVGAYSADQARSAQNNATDAASQAAASQTEVASRQQQLAQQQWEHYRDVYEPRANARDDAQWALTQRVANQQMDDSAHLRSLSDQSFDQAKKSWEFQDQYSQTARDYSSGKMGNVMADEANADVENASAGTAGSIARNAGRMGINPGSGAYAGALDDAYTNKMLASAGAQTTARRQARDKAEQMVGIAAGAGTAGFGTGLTAAGLATGANAGAVGAISSGVSNGNSSANTYTNGMNGASSAFSGAGASYGGASANYRGIAPIVSNNPMAEFGSGLLSSGLRAWGSGGGGFSNPFARNTSNDVGMPMAYNTDTGTTYRPSDNYGPSS